jgi:hypothetical protein
MVEPRLIYASKEVYMGRPKIAYRSKGLYAVGGKILYGWERFCCSRYTLLIAAGSQPIVQGRAKIIRGVEFKHTCMRMSDSIICSREVAYSWVNISYGQTNHYYR